MLNKNGKHAKKRLRLIYAINCDGQGLDASFSNLRHNKIYILYKWLDIHNMISIISIMMRLHKI